MYIYSSKKILTFTIFVFMISHVDTMWIVTV